jgi:hypothetical protein
VSPSRRDCGEFGGGSVTQHWRAGLSYAAAKGGSG